MKNTVRAMPAATGIEILRTYVTEITDSDGRRCTPEEVEKFANPVLAMQPELINTFTWPELVAFGKSLERDGLLAK